MRAVPTTQSNNILYYIQYNGTVLTTQSNNIIYYIQYNGIVPTSQSNNIIYSINLNCWYCSNNSIAIGGIISIAIAACSDITGSTHKLT